MDFSLNSEQELLKKTVREFAENEISPVIEELDRQEEFSYELTAKMGDLGFFAIIVSPAYGGLGMDYLSYILVVEELSRVDASQAATIAAAISLGIGPIYTFGSKEQKKKFLPNWIRSASLNVSLQRILPAYRLRCWQIL